MVLAATRRGPAELLGPGFKVAQAIGTQRESGQATFQELFNAKFSEALKTVGKQLDFADLSRLRVPGRAGPGTVHRRARPSPRRRQHAADAGYLP